MPPRRAIIVDLIARGLSIEFNGKHVDLWKVAELKKFIRVFSAQPTRTQGLDKQQLCVKLAQIKRSIVTSAESQILSGVLDGTKSIDGAHSQLTSAQATDVKPTSDRMCELCSESKTQAEFPTISAPDDKGDDRAQEHNTKHAHEKFTTCIECLEKHIATKSNSTNFLKFIECPEQGCKAFLDTSLMQHAPPAILTRYTTYIATAAQQAQCPSITCANLHCQHTIPIPATDPNNPTRPATDLDCPKCSYPNCIKCGTFSHMMQDHQQNRIFLRSQAYREILSAKPSIATTTDSKTDNVKLCPNPNCRTILTLKGGCPNATCAVCYYKFCWHCDQVIEKGGKCKHLRGKGCEARLKGLKERYAAKAAKDKDPVGNAEREGGKAMKKKNKKTRGKEAYLKALMAESEDGDEDGDEVVKGEEDE